MSTDNAEIMDLGEPRPNRYIYITASEYIYGLENIAEEEIKRL